MNIRRLTRIALCAALTAVAAQIIVPLPFTPVPFSCAILAVFLCGALLDPWSAFLTQGVYLLMGLVGLPVFSGFGAGPGKLLGPTGGYLVSYLFVAWLISLLLSRAKHKTFLRYFAAMLCGLAVCYLFGTLWLGWMTARPFAEALAMGVLPFVGFDVAKAALAGAMAMVLEKPLARLAHS